MISSARLRALAREDGVTAGLAEENYANSWILSAIYTGPLANQLIFKGGTSLSKLYFPEIWCFSEDLDFTATDPIPDLHEQLATALDETATQSGIGFEITSIHETGDPIEYTQINVQYDAVLDQKNTTDLDITFNEPLAFSTVEHYHSFEEIPQFSLPAYSIEEIFVEKLRSLYQRARARDYYDIYHLLAQETFDDSIIPRALWEKSAAHNVEIDVENGIPDDDIEEVRAYWERALNRLVTEKPPFDIVVQQINAYLGDLAER
jgi:predicted nucleotidyltransferase component of viral defense system